MSAWLSWDATPFAWVALAAVIVAAVVSARHYASASATARLPAFFRAVVLGMLALTAWQPTLQFVDRSGKPRPLRVMIDDSLSMGVVDAGRSAGEWLRVAAALGRYDSEQLSAATRDAERLRTALADLRQADEALAARQTESAAVVEKQRVAGARSAARRAADALLSSAEQVGCTAETLDALRGALAAIEAGADPTGVGRELDNVAADIRRQSLAEDEQVAADDPAALAAVRTSQGATRYELAVAAVARLQTTHAAAVSLSTFDGRDPLPDSPSAAATPLTASLRDACARAAADGAEGVVLFSDGRSTETRSLLASVAASGIPVFTVEVAPDDRSPDVRVSRVDTRPAVLAGQPVDVRVRLSQRNAAGHSVRITLTDGIKEVARTIQLGNDNTFELTWPSAVAPELNLTVQADGVSGETRMGNNVESTDTVVFGQRQRVLCLAPEGGRDVNAFSAAMAEAPWIDLQRPNVIAGKPVTVDAAAWASADLIALADLPPDALDEAAWAALTREVREGGKSLLILPGNGDWLSEPAVGRHLASLLPTTPGPRPAWVTRPSEVWPVPTRFGTDAAYLRLDESADASLRAWLGRPKLSRVFAAGAPSASARPLLVDRSTQIPLLIESAVGGGRVALMLTDEVWRWSTAADSAASRRFWLGLADALYDMPYSTIRDGLSLSLDRQSVQAGRTVGVRCRVADPAAGAATLSVTKNGVLASAPPLHELLPGGGRYETTLNLPPGKFDLVLRQAGRLVPATLVVTADAQLELADTAPDAALLTRIADATGGVMLPLEGVGRLPELIAQRRDRTQRVVTYAVWSSPYWFGVIVACMSMEWALRPRSGRA